MLHYDCMSFIEHNDYPMTCLDLAQYVVCMMSATAQSDKLPGFYMHIALFELPLYTGEAVSPHVKVSEYKSSDSH
jgi:hypothetical protein